MSIRDVDHKMSGNPPLFSLPITDAFDATRSSEAGLRERDATRRMVQYGPNALPETPPASVLKIFFRQFISPFIYLLLAACVVMFALHEIGDGVIVLIVLFFNAIIGTVQEGKAQDALVALRRLVETSATVLRDGEEKIVAAREIVPGDILILRQGERVAADARLIVTHDLTINESSLTGESLSVQKDAGAIVPATAQTADQITMVFTGTAVVGGGGRAVVTATGIRSVMGKIAREMESIHSDIPLKKNLDALSRVIIISIAVLCILVFVLGMLTGNSVLNMFVTAVSLAVSAIPEGLPAVVTLVLASGVHRMSKKNALVKRLQAVEALGQARVIAVDKTGTITKNELMVSRVWSNGNMYEVKGEGYSPIGEIRLNDKLVHVGDQPDLMAVGKIAALGVDAELMYAEDEKKWEIAGDPTEASLVVYAQKVGFDRSDLLKNVSVLGEVPFDYRIKYRAVLVSEKGRKTICVTGAPENLLTLSSHVYKGATRKAMTVATRASIEAEMTKLSEQGLRVVALAIKSTTATQVHESDVKELTFVGFVGMQDTLRPEVHEAMQRAQGAGIRVVMITGDNAITARAIAEQAGIYEKGDEVITGAEIEVLSASELADRVAKVSVFARVTPEHKLMIIEAFKRRGEIIAMTGDGVNDAPSLMAADLGVAMGKIGTEVAKEASDIILTDDNFGTIVSAIEEGRHIFRTIQKVILYLVSTNLGEVLVIVFSILIGLPLPLLAAQIIWLNFVTDGFLDVALAMGPMESDILKRPFEKPPKYIISGSMLWRMSFMAIIMVVSTLALFAHYIHLGDVAKAMTVALTVLAVSQWFNAWNCRSERKSLFQSNPFHHKYLIGATLIVASLHLVAVYTPFMQNLLHTVPLSGQDWMLIMATASSIIILEELRKFVQPKVEAYVRNRD